MRSCRERAISLEPTLLWHGLLWWWYIIHPANRAIRRSPPPAPTVSPGGAGAQRTTLRCQAGFIPASRGASRRTIALGAHQASSNRASPAGRQGYSGGARGPRVAVVRRLRWRTNSPAERLGLVTFRCASLRPRGSRCVRQLLPAPPVRPNPSSWGLPPARALARAPASVIIRRAGQAPSRRQPLPAQTLGLSSSHGCTRFQAQCWSAACSRATRAR